MATNWIVEAITSAVSETGTKTANLANGSNFNIHDSTDDTQIFRILNDSSDYYSMTLYGHDGQPAKFYMAADNGTTQGDAWLWQVTDDSGSGSIMSWKARSSGTVDPQGDTYANTTMSLDTSGNLTTLGDLTITGGNITNALTLDSTLAVTAATTLSNVFSLTSTTADQLKVKYDASNYALLNVSSSGDLEIETIGAGTTDSDITLNADGDIVLDADGGNIYLKDGGTTYMDIQVDGSNDTIAVTGDLTLDISGDMTIDVDGGDFKIQDGGSGALMAHITSGSSLALGHLAGPSGGLAAGSIAIGKEALAADGDALGVIAIGREALKASTGGAGDYNVAIGFQSMENCTAPGAQNVAIGYNALLHADFEGSWQIAIGGQALTALEDGDYNTAIGRYSLMALVEGHNNTAVGYGALKAQTHSSNTAVGYLAGNVTVGGDGNTIVGANAFGLNTAASLQNVIIGRSAMAGTVGNVNDYNVAIGAHVMDSTGVESTGSVAIGYGAGGAAAFTANNVVTIGSESGYDNTSGGSVFLGYRAGYNNTTGTQNTFVGYNAGRGHDSIPLTGADNTVLGSEAGYSLQGAALKNTIIGSGAGEFITIGTHNTMLGYNAGGDSSAAGLLHTTLIGAYAGDAIEDNHADGTVAVGYQAASALTDGRYNVAVGFNALVAATDSDRNTAIGYQALQAMTGTTGDTNNTALGHNAGLVVTTGVKNTFVGTYAGDGTDDGDKNTAVGQLALSANCGNSNTAVGNNALKVSTSNSNTAVGAEAGALLEEGLSNVAIGANALDAEVEGSGNVAIGPNALTVQNAGGTDNTHTYTDNTAIGRNAGNTITTGIQNTGLGSGVAFDVDANNQTAIGYGATTASSGANTIMMGNSSMTDIYMGDDGNAWSQISDKRLKRNIEDWNVGLNAINKLRIRQFQFNEDNVFGFSSDKKRQGIIAQEAKEAIPEMVKENSEGWLSANNEPMVWAMVNAIQELSAQVEELKSKLGE